MAYESNQDPNQQQQQSGTMNVLAPGAQPKQAEQAPQQSAGGQGQNISGSGSSQVGSGQPAPASSSNKPNQSGLFTNIRSFFDANKGAGQQIADTGSNMANNQASQIGQAVQEKQHQFQGAGQQAQQQMTDTQNQGLQTVQNIMQGQMPQDYSSYQNALQGNNSSGKAFSDIGNLDLSQQQSQQQNLANQAQQASSNAGQFTLLRSIFGNPQAQQQQAPAQPSVGNYTTGQQTLDTAFLQNSPQAKQGMLNNIQAANTQSANQISGAQNAFNGIQSQLTNQQSDLQKALADAQSGATNKITTGVNQKVSDWTNNYNNIKSAMDIVNKTGNLGSLSPDQYKMLTGQDAPTTSYADLVSRLGMLNSNAQNSLGVSTGSAATAQNYNVADTLKQLAAYKDITGGAQGATNNYFNQIGMPTSYDLASRLASPEEVAKASALAKLSGKDQTIYDASIAGKTDTLGNYGLNNSNYKQYLTNTQSTLDKQLGAIQQQASNFVKNNLGTPEQIMSNMQPGVRYANENKSAAMGAALQSAGFPVGNANRLGMMMTGMIQPSNDTEKQQLTAAFKKFNDMTDSAAATAREQLGPPPAYDPNNPRATDDYNNAVNNLRAQVQNDLLVKGFQTANYNEQMNKGQQQLINTAAKYAGV